LERSEKEGCQKEKEMGKESGAEQSGDIEEGRRDWE
jgi:hypothetical protein